jgi:O-antigen biosynthesis protein
MKLSIIIVNYNVKHFIEQCLHSVYKAIKGSDIEVYVVDNNSVDGSCQMIRNKFPGVKLIENKKNEGFAKANNIAIRESKGKYVLLLNPDTVVQEDTFDKCMAFMEFHPEAGALGVKMINGKGNFLPESKRALPTPSVAFYKISGLSKIFPRSKIFGRYHLGHLNKEQTNEIEILSGAFMFIRKETLDKTGLLDENFFMYGEDIDLSYRILNAGYKNYYFPDTTIIHYKGESTKKGSLNYVVMFYNAMKLFAEKHFSKSNLWLFSFIIKLAIILRATIAIFKRLVKQIYLPVIDSALIFSGYLFLKPWWESIKFEGGGKYPGLFIHWIVPAYIIIWLICLVFTGVYDKPLKISKIIKGVGIGTLLILSVYALLPISFRFSRILIILGAIWSAISLTTFRYFMHVLNIKAFKLGELLKKRIVIVGDSEEFFRVKQLLNQIQFNPEIIGFVSDKQFQSPDYIGNLKQLEDIVSIYKVEEIIFCAKDITSQEIIDHMLYLSNIDVEYKIAPPESLSIIGSNSINTSGDLYLINLNAINGPASLREKRLFDIITSMLLLISVPVLLFFVKNKLKSIMNIFKVLIGTYTWIGYYSQQEFKADELPKIKKGILSPVDGLEKKNVSEELKERLNYMYAKNYQFTNDLNIILRGLPYIGR